MYFFLSLAVLEAVECSLMNTAAVFIAISNSFTNQPANSLRGEANSISGSQKIHRFLWNPKIHYLAHKSRSLNPFMSQINQFHAEVLFFEDTF